MAQPHHDLGTTAQPHHHLGTTALKCLISLSIYSSKFLITLQNTPYTSKASQSARHRGSPQNLGWWRWEWGCICSHRDKTEKQSLHWKCTWDLTEFGEDLAKLEAEPEPNKTEEIEGSQVHPAFSWPVLLFSSTQLAAHQLPDCSATPVALGPLSSSLT